MPQVFCTPLELTTSIPAPPLGPVILLVAHPEPKEDQLAETMGVGVLANQATPVPPPAMPVLVHE